MIVDADVADQIDDAIVSLDEEWSNRRHWLSQIDTEKLDMADEGQCILGQLYGYFGAAPAALRALPGFTGSIPRGAYERHEPYRAAWVAAIEDMRRTD